MTFSNRMRTAAALVALCILAPAANAVLVYAISPTATGAPGSNLFSFDSATPGAASAPVGVSGLQAGESLVGIDFRPANGLLYGLGSSSRLYTINPATGAATQVGSAGAFILTGTQFGVDFNPVPDRLRVTSDADQNLRLNPNDGTLTATDTPLAYALLDTNTGANPNIVGSAYTNNFAGAATTTLFGIDANLDILVTQSPPNNGTLNTVGGLGVNTTGRVGFDIFTDAGGTNTAFASLTVQTSSFYTINLSTGAASLVGSIGTNRLVDDIAIVPGAVPPGNGQIPLPPALLLGLPAAIAALHRGRRHTTWLRAKNHRRPKAD